MFNTADHADETGLVFACNYYAILSQGVNGLPLLENLYADNSVLSHEGERLIGRSAILAKLQQVVRIHATFGNATHCVEDISCQAINDTGAVLVHLKGTTQLCGAKNAPPSVFKEVFVLYQAETGEYYVANQIFRLIS